MNTEKEKQQGSNVKPEVTGAHVERGAGAQDSELIHSQKVKLDGKI